MGLGSTEELTRGTLDSRGHMSKGTDGHIQVVGRDELPLWCIWVKGTEHVLVARECIGGLSLCRMDTSTLT